MNNYVLLPTSCLDNGVTVYLLSGLGFPTTGEPRDPTEGPGDGCRVIGVVLARVGLVGLR